PDAHVAAGQVLDVERADEDEIPLPRRAYPQHVHLDAYHYENGPNAALAAIEEITPVRPCGVALHTAQQRARERQFLADRGFPTAPYSRAASLDELWDAVARIGTPTVIKTAALRSDGKGQHKVTTPAGIDPTWTHTRPQ